MKRLFFILISYIHTKMSKKSTMNTKFRAKVGMNKEICLHLYNSMII